MECTSCKASIRWAVTPAGKKMPVDAFPSSDGNVLILNTTALDDPLAIVLSGLALEAAQNKTPKMLYLRTSHFFTCPYAAQHRKRK